jgi:hypothetical protein
MRVEKMWPSCGGATPKNPLSDERDLLRGYYLVRRRHVQCHMLHTKAPTQKIGIDLGTIERLEFHRLVGYGVEEVLGWHKAHR